MKADRLMSALLLLQARGRLTGRELAEQLEVSARTVHRDMESLSASGVPIYALRGAQGGWQLDENWRTEIPGLSEAELRALLMAQPRTLGHPRLVAAAETAYNKLIASLPRNMRQQATAMRERLHVDATGWHLSNEDLSMLPVVQEAVAQDRRLSFEYTRSDGARDVRIVDPLGIVAKGTSWYLAARAPKGLRTYRISRMSGVVALAARFKRPSGFNLEDYWKKSTEELQTQRRRYEVTLSMEPKAARSLATWLEITEIEDSAPLPAKGWVTFRTSFDSAEHARFVLLGFGARARVLDPVSLQKIIDEEARAMVALAARKLSPRTRRKM